MSNEHYDIVKVEYIPKSADITLSITRYHSVYDYSWSKTLHQWEAGRKCKFFSLSRLKLTPYLSSYNSSKVFFLHIHPPQIFTHDLLHPIMNIFQVSFQVTFMRKFLRAINTGKWLIPCMTSVMQ